MPEKKGGRAERTPEYAEYSSRTRYIIMVALMLGTLMQVIDTSIVNVAIPQMMGNLGATVDQIGWVSTGYIISNVIVLPLTGWLASRFGRRRYLAVSVALFTASSFLCGISWDLGSLIFFRVLQGMGGAALISTSQATMMEIFPPSQIAMVQAIYGLGVVVGPTVGPTLGGWITDNYNWPWIFFINVPVGIVAASLTYIFVRDSKYRRDRHNVDAIGIGLLAVGLGSLQTVLEKGNREGWYDSSMICWLTLAAVVGLASFVWWELRTPHPAVNLRVLKHRALAAGSLFGGVVGVGLFGGIFILPIYLQGTLHCTAEQSGIILFPGGLSTALVLPLVGRLSSRVRPQYLVAVGATGFTISMFMLRTLTTSTGPTDLFWPLVVRGASLGFVFVPLSLAALSGLHKKDLAEGAGLYNLVRQVGGSFGIAILSTLLDHRTALHRASLVEFINIHNPNTIERLQTYQNGLIAMGSLPAAAKSQALALLNQVVQGQAAVMAFEDVFLVVGMIFIVAMPLLLLFNRKSPLPHAAKRAPREG